MTNYDMTMDMLAASTFHPDSVEQARKYLRDLKASHDALVNAVNKIEPVVLHYGSSQNWVDVAAAIKAAEALR